MAMRKLILAIVFIFSFSLVVGASFNNPQVQSFSGTGAINYNQFNNPSLGSIYSQGDISTYWPGLAESMNQGNCQAGTDFLVMIPPAGCTPGVVRSDLLAEQNVPVFCQLYGVKVNPLIDVSSLRHISFQGNYSKDIVGVSYHPSKAALRSYNSLVGNPTLENLGYVVVVLRKQANESSLKKFVEGNLTATMSYDADAAFGLGASDFYLETSNDEDWSDGVGAASFWNGKGLLRVLDVQGDRARIGIYTDDQRKINEVSVKLGETSSRFYFPGFYCQAGLKVKLNSLVGEDDRVLLNVDGDNIWAIKGSKILNGRCTVTDINLVGGNAGDVKIRCPSGSFTLSLANSLAASLNVDGKSSLYNVSNLVLTDSRSTQKTDWYLGYVGSVKNPAGYSGMKFEDKFIVLLSSSGGKAIDNKKYSALSSYIGQLNSGKAKLGSSGNLETGIARILNVKQDSVRVVLVGQGFLNELSYDSSNLFLDIINPELEITQDTSTERTKLTEEEVTQVNSYFESADKAIKDLLETYPQVKKAGTDSKYTSTYGEEVILSAVNLIDQLASKGIRYDEKRTEYLNKFLELYPQSGSANYVRELLERESGYDSSRARTVVYVNNQYKSISLEKISPADDNNRNVSLVITPQGQQSQRKTLSKNEEYNLSVDKDNNVLTYLKVVDVQPRYVSIDFYKQSKDKASYSKVISGKRLNYDFSGEDIGTKITIENTEYTLLVDDINVKELASVSIIPEVSTSSKANFSFKIGIEQRNIKINPEKAKEVSNQLNETIKKWEEKNKRLGDVLVKWKQACYVTGLGLQVKNLFGGFTGESLARKETMEAYRARCLSNETIVIDGKDVSPTSVTRQKCYETLSNSIESDVDLYAKAVEQVNKNVGSQTLEQWKKNNSEVVVLKDGKKVSTSQFYSFEDVRAYLLYKFISPSASSTLRTKLETERDSRLLIIWNAENKNAELVSAKDGFKNPDLSNAVYSTESLTKSKFVVKGYNSQKTLTEFQGMLAGQPTSEPAKTAYEKLQILLGQLSGGDPAKKIGYSIAPGSGGENPTLILIAGGGSESAVIKGTFRFVEQNNKIAITSQAKESDYQIDPNFGRDCNYASTGNIKTKVQFYDSGSNKGMPGVVPIDNKGYYAFIGNSQGGFTSDSVKSYTASGVPSFYYICTVGPNGIMELKGGDDSCFSSNVNVDANTYLPCGLTANEVSTLRSKAESAIRQAASQYGKGNVLTINGMKVNVDVPLSESGDLPYECTDFMSVDECKTLFNVCDPVVCPSSRCNLGGNYPVANVVQSGIVGSLLLCSNNFVGFGGDVYVPICLTGVHAGIEGYVSILKSQQSCMAEVAKTGKHVGICDEITAVYKCEFFWRQAGPFLKNIVPGLVQSLYSGGQEGLLSGSGKGGGEYATFQSAWDNAEAGVKYFQTTYGGNSFRAFQVGGIEEVGTEFCRNFVGTSLPNTGNALDQIMKPESPHQFYAQFSEIPFTEATVPATSQYKVFYHIYAGNDEGASFQVYLKNPPSSSYYYNSQYLNVKSGYIAAGQQATETKDFTAPAGYKELCVVINGKEECGFKSVTTDFGLNYLSDAYKKDQAERTDIATEKECVQGSSSVYALANLNPQAAVEDATQPNIALSGIVRVCATENPGKGTNSVRWKNVGNCGSDKIGCWLDTLSVNNTVKQVYDATGSVQSAKDAIDNKINAGIDGTWDDKTTSEELSKIKNNVSSLTEEKIFVMENILADLAVYQEKSSSDVRKAEGMLWEYYLYEKVISIVGKLNVQELLKKESNLAPPASAEKAISNDVKTTSVSDSSESVSTSSSKYSLASDNKMVLDSAGQFTGYYLIYNSGRYVVASDSDGKTAFIVYNSDTGKKAFYPGVKRDQVINDLFNCNFGLSGNVPVLNCP